MLRKLIAGAIVLLAAGGAFAVTSGLPAALSPQTQECLGCHRNDNPGLYQQWGVSVHYSANVGCFECHQAEVGDPDLLKDGIHDEFLISTIVSPLDCKRCHAKEVAEFLDSHHSKSGRIMGSLDNLLAEVVEGNNGMTTPMFPEGISAAAVNGCWQCHGSVVKVNANGTLDPATWPNTGMGRVNPDGSEGSCTACHQRHDFDVAQARHPDNCGKCHLGPDHPQKEIYEESKHGIAFSAHEAEMNLESKKWIVGEDYSAAPTCATCHMSATTTQDISHNIGLRIKWNNRPAHSKLSHTTDKAWGLASAAVTSDQRRANMRDVCRSCHQENFVTGFFVQYEALLDLYETKYAKPGEALYKAARAVMSKDPAYAEFSQPVDWTWFELWHHEGRRARHAASMMAPDYTHWHGTYELARNWMTKFIPELRDVAERYRTRFPTEVATLEKLIDDTESSPDWNWSLNREDPAVKADREKRAAEFKDRYK
jgi:hydroxylamine dehydrogenase